MLVPLRLNLDSGIVSPPVIIANPFPQSVLTGGTATFMVVATGAGLSYQWYKGGIAITGATSSTYSYPAPISDNGALFTVTVTNGGGSVTSTAAQLTVVSSGAVSISGVTTAQDLITRAMRRLNVVAAGETPTVQELLDGLTILNDLLDSWSTEHLTVYNNVENVVNFTAGKGTYTVGTGGDWTFTRPLRLTNAYTRIGNYDYPMQIIANDDYTAIGYKVQPGPWPDRVYYNLGQPLGQLFFWPVPSQAGELHLWCDQILTTFSSLTQTVYLPQGYIRAIVLNLAVELAPEYGREIHPALAKTALDAKKNVKALNAQPTAVVRYDAGLPKARTADAGFILHGGFSK